MNACAYYIYQVVLYWFCVLLKLNWRLLKQEGKVSGEDGEIKGFDILLLISFMLDNIHLHNFLV